MSAKSNELVNELVSACIAFGRQVEPDWQTRIETAQRELREYVEGLEAESERFTVHSDIERQDDKWIPVSERLPEANKCVLIYDAGGNMTVDILVKSGGVETYFWLPKYRILFWMPIPEPPEVK